MRSLPRFWRAIEELRGLAAVMGEWRALLGDELDLVMPFLRPRQERATSYPRLDGRGVLYEVVEHGPGDFVGVCPETGEVVPLVESDLVVYELDRRRLARQAAEALGVGPLPEAPEGALVSLGTARHASARLPAFLAFPHRADDLHLAAASLITERKAPYVLLAPSARLLVRGAEAAVRSHGCVFVPLDEATRAPAPGRLRLVEPLGTIIAQATGALGGEGGGVAGRNVFRREGDYWSLSFEGRSVRVKDGLGLRCIAHLIAEKGTDVLASALHAVATAAPVVKPAAGLEASDGQALASCAARLAELRAELEKARKHNDFAAQGRAEKEIGEISRYVGASVGLGATVRKVKDGANNARMSVTNAIGRAIRQIDGAHCELARHLERSIRTGQSCSYSPSPDVDWDL